MIAHFVSACNDIKIRRYEPNEVVSDTLQVAFSYGPKTRAFWDRVQKKNVIRLPLVNVAINSINRAEQRVANNVLDMMHNSSTASQYLTRTRPPVPVDLGISMTIFTEYQRDMEQILTNWIPYFDPFIAISWTHPITKQELQSRIIWSGQAPIQSPDNLDSQSPLMWQCDTSFVMEGFLFKSDVPPAKKIIKINTSWTPVDTIFCNIADNEAQQSTFNTDCLSLTGLPVPMIPSLLCIKQGQWTQVSIFGRMLTDLTGIFVSGGTGVTVSSASAWNLFDVASAGGSLTSTCHNITGYAVPDFVVGNNQVLTQPNVNSDQIYQTSHSLPPHVPWNTVTFWIPPVSGSGYIDIIITNPGGCGSLSRSSYLHLINPYPSDDPKHDTWSGQQYPWYNLGIFVGEAVDATPH